MEDFLSKNRQEWPVAFPKDKPSQVLVMSQSEISKASKDKTVGKPISFWDALQKNHPNVEAVIETSRVGFSADGVWAFLFFDIVRGPLAGHADFWVLKRREGRWEVYVDLGRNVTY